MDDDKLTPEQIKNWRHVMAQMIGPIALIMPDEKVQAFRDMMQCKLNELPEKGSDGNE